MRTRLKLRALALGILSLSMGLGGIVFAGHLTTSYTGCLSRQGTLYNIQAGDATVAPCRTGDATVHFSGGDITTVIAGAGLIGGGMSGAVTLALDYATLDSRYQAAGSKAADAELLDGRDSAEFAAAAHNHDGRYWSLTGNAGTSQGTNFIGTTDAAALDLRTNSATRLYISGSGDVGIGTSLPSQRLHVVGDTRLQCSRCVSGAGNNAVTAGAIAATIAGGGSSAGHRVTDHFGTVGGGNANQAGNDDGDPLNAQGATVAGGSENSASGTASTISGGIGNSASAGRATISGGEDNLASGGFATVSGGLNNSASGLWATTAGGQSNQASGTAAAVGGGESNSATSSRAVVGGGFGNSATGSQSTVAGGGDNLASGLASTVAGGRNSVASASFASVPGGFEALASHYGEMAHANGSFGTRGDAQSSTYVLRGITTDASVHELFLDGLSQRITIAPGRTLVFDVLLVARGSAGESAGYIARGVIENEDGSTAFIAPPALESLGQDSLWGFQVAAANDALSLRVTGALGASIRWVASVRTVEVNY